MIFNKKNKEIDFLNKLEKNILNPLTYIQGYSSVLKNNKNLENDVLDYVNKIELYANRIFTTTQSFLYLFELQSLKTKIKIESVNLLNIVQPIFEKYERVFKKTKIKINFELQNNFNIVSNRKYLHQVINVLFEEVFLIMEKGTVDVLLRKQGSDMVFELKIYTVDDSKIKLNQTPGYELSEYVLKNIKGRINFKKEDKMQKIELRFFIAE